MEVPKPIARKGEMGQKLEKKFGDNISMKNQTIRTKEEKKTNYQSLLCMVKFLFLGFAENNKK